MSNVQLNQTVLIQGYPVAPGIYAADAFTPESTAFLTENGFLVPAADPQPAATPVEPPKPLDMKSLRAKRAPKNAPAATE